MSVDRPDHSDLPGPSDRHWTTRTFPARVRARLRVGPGLSTDVTAGGRHSDGRHSDVRVRARRRGRVLGEHEAGTRTVRSESDARPHDVVAAVASAGPPGRWSPDAIELRLLSELVDSGLTLEQALAQLRDVGRAGRRAAGLAWVHEQVRAGVSLPDALADVGASRHVIALLAGAELSGRTAPGLDAAASLLERMEELRATVRRASTYPAIVLGVGVVVLLIVTTTVVPRLEATFIDLGGELPYATRVVMAFSAAIRSPWMLTSSVALGVLALVRRAAVRSGVPAGARSIVTGIAGHIGVWGTDDRRPIGWLDRVRGGGLPVGPRTVLARLAPRLPIVGPLRLAIDVAVAARVVATLADQGVAVHVALDLAADGMSLAYVRQAMRRAARAMRAGATGTGDDELGLVLDRLELRMLDVGVTQGVLPPQWSRIAARRTRQLEVRLAALGAAIEPLLVVVVGLVVGGAVLALYLPSFRVLELL